MPLASHGSLTRAQTCGCPACAATISRVYYKTPRAVKPPLVRKLGKALVTIEPAAERGVLSLRSEYEFTFGNSEKVAVVGVCHPETWDDLMDDDANITLAQNAVSEAVKQVPSAHKVHVDPNRYKTRPTTSVMPGEDPRQPIALPVLMAQMRVMTTGLVTGETDIGVAIKAYGALRDEIARRRHEFAEVEGVFEALQRAITAKVSE